MYIRDIMATNIVTIPSTTSIADAKRIMQAHKFRRLPIVDKGKLVGIVTEHGLEKVSPSKATSLTIWEVSYLLDKTPVKDVMEKSVVAVSPDMTVEESLATAQSRKVGALVVVEDGKVVGMVTTNDFFYKIVNPVLGLGLAGHRLEVTGGGEVQKLEEILSVTNRHCLELTNLHIISLPGAKEKDVVIHLNCPEVSEIIADLEGRGYKVRERRR